MILHWYVVAAVLVNAYFFVAALSNVLYLRSATSAPRVDAGPFVSVIVPARNEERTIARCLGSLLAQDYADYEVIVVDDQSEDRTAEIVAGIAAREPRLRMVSAGPLPPGWLGKPHALCRGAALARGDILLLTDADTTHEPVSVSWAVTNLEDQRADMLSGYLRQQYGSIGEALVVPTMYAAMLLVPLWLVPRTRSSQLAFAIGQYVAIRREAFDAIGGYDAIKDSIVDDMSLATRVKACGFREVFLDAKNAASCRLYTGYRTAFSGIERSVYSALGANPLSAVAVTLIVLAFIVGPAVSVLGALIRLELPSGMLGAAAVLFIAIWGLVAIDRDVPFTAFVLYPVVFFSLLTILAASMVTTGFGEGLDWKGRTIHVPRRARAEHKTGAAGPASHSGTGS